LECGNVDCVLIKKLTAQTWNNPNTENVTISPYLVPDVSLAEWRTTPILQRLFDVCAICAGQYGVLTVPMLGLGSVADKQAVMESMFSVCSVMSEETAVLTSGL
jgi:hypothetical protein